MNLCAATSHNLVSTLLPALKVAVEKNKNILAVKSLEKAKEWIDGIINKVEQIVDRYEKQNLSVASCTTEVIAVKNEKDKNIQQTSQEIEALQKVVNDIEEELKKNTTEIGKVEANIEAKNQELHSLIRDYSHKNKYLRFFSAIAPFIKVIAKFFHDHFTGPGVAAKAQALSNELSQLNMEKSNLRNKEWTIHIRLTDMQLKLAIMKMQQGTISDPVHLNDVQMCLSRIQNILIQLQKFWESVGILLESLKDETFANECFIEESEVKSALSAIDLAEKHWKSFGEGCRNAMGIFSLQTKDAYKFLETSPTSLSPEEWKKQYDDVIVKLNKISPVSSSPQEPAAITE